MIARRVGLAVATLGLLCLPWLSAWPAADLSNVYSDHLRHAFVVQVALDRGLAIYRLPLKEAGRGFESRHPGFYWADVPYAYPPGALLLFLPLSAFSEAFVEEPKTHARLLVTFTTLLGVLAWLATLRVLFPGGGGERSELAGRALVAAFAFGLLVHCGLEGFYDPAWVALGALAMLRLEQKDYPGALAWCAGAFALHLRAVALAPVAVAALLGLYRARGGRALAHPAVIVLGGAGLVDVAVFVAARPFAAVFRDGSRPLTEAPGVLAICLAGSLVAGAICFWRGRPLAAAAVGVALLLAAVDVRGFWHATVVLVPLLLVAGSLASSQPAGGWRHRAALATALLVIWAVQLQRFAWGGRAWDLPRGIAYMATKGGVDPIP